MTLRTVFSSRLCPPGREPRVFPGMRTLRSMLARLKPFPMALAMLIAASETRAEPAPGAASESSDAEPSGRFYAGGGIHLSESLVPYPRYRFASGQFELSRSYPSPGISLSLDLEVQVKRSLIGGSFHMGNWGRTELPGLISLHAWLAYLLGSGEIAPYVGGGFGALLLVDGEDLRLGPAANVTVGVMFFRSRRYLRPELTLQILLPLFDTSGSMTSLRAPAFLPMALLGIRLLI